MIPGRRTPYRPASAVRRPAIRDVLLGAAAVLALASPVAAAERSLDLRLSEGTWMHPDVSPDGRTILFNILGDIFRVGADGGPAQPVLAGTAFETNPVYSPDGKHFAFISDRSGVTNLWVADADGRSARQLSQEGELTVFASPAWSPDGRAVFVSRMKHPVLAFELWRYSVDGGAGVRMVASQPNNEGWDDRINALGAAISPDGRYAYYSKKLGHTWTEKAPPNWWIARRDLGTGVEDKLIESAGGAMRPALSHDGRWLAYASRAGAETGLRLRNLETGADRWLAFPIDHDGQEQGYYADLTPRYAFAPDDRSLIASVGGKLGRIDVATGRLAPIPFTADLSLALGRLTRVAQREETGPVRVRVIQGLKVSPDGRRIAFTALGKLYVQDLAAGSAPRPVAGAPGPAFQPSWSPDGKTLTFVTWSSVEGGAVWTIPASGGSAKRLTREVAYFTEPAFAPDGSGIVALRANHADRLQTTSEVVQDRTTDIVRIPTQGGPPVLIAHAFGARLLDPASQPGRIRFYAPEGAISVRVDGTDLRRELVVKATAWSQYVSAPMLAEDVRLNPKGDLALVRTASELYLVEVPPANGATPEVSLERPGAGATRLTSIGADAFDWADGGQTIVWSLGASVRRLPLSAVDRSAPGASETKAATFDATVTAPRDTPRGVVVLRGATVVTLRGDEVIQGADIVVSDDRILAVGKTGAVATPAGATIRDVSGKFIVPGFVDAHAHWFELRRQVQDDQPWPLLANLAYGVTSGLDPQSFTNDVFVYQDMVDAGLAVGPRVYSTGTGVFHNSPMATVAETEAVLSRYRDAYRTRNIKAYMVGDRAQRGIVVAAAKAAGVMPTTEGASDLNLDLTHVLDGFSGNEHALPVSPLRDDVIQLFARGGTSLTPTLSVLYGGMPPLANLIIGGRLQDDPKLRRFTPPGVIAEKLRDQHWTPPGNQSHARFAADALKIQRAGGVVALGSHGAVQGLGFHWEMKLYASGGATPLEVLRAASLGSATAIGRADDIGSLEPGKFADLLILDADPLADIANVDRIREVMKGGRLYDAASLNEVWPRQKSLPRLWFAQDPPARTLPGAP